MGIFGKKEVENIRFRAIVEIIGKPKEHVEQTLAVVVENMKGDTHWTVNEAKLPPAEEQGALFVAFADCDITAKTFSDILAFCFEYMPSTIDIHSPTEFALDAHRVNAWINDYLGRLHESDLIAKKTRADNEVLQRNSTQIFRNFLQSILHSGPKDAKHIATQTGIPIADIEKFLAPFLKEGWMTSDGKTYALKL